MVRLGSGSGDMKRARAGRHRPRHRRARSASASVAESSRRVDPRRRHERGARGGEPRRLRRRARDEAGIEVEVISGVEEARLIHLGVLQAVPVFDQRLHADRHRRRQHRARSSASGARCSTARSLKLGAIRLTERFFGGEPRAAAAAVDELPSVRALGLRAVRAARCRDCGFEVAVGSSGTILSDRRDGRRRSAGEPAPITLEQLRAHRRRARRRGRGAPQGRHRQGAASRSRASTRNGPTSSSAARSCSSRSFARAAHRRA